MAAVAHCNRTRNVPGSRLARLFARVRGICAGLTIAVCCGFAPAQDVSLVWVAPKECPQAADVRALLRRLLADSAAGAERVEAAAHVDPIRGHSYRLKLHLSVGAHRAQRWLESESCEDLASTAAWLVAVAIDPNVHDAQHPQATERGADGSASESPTGQAAEEAARRSGEATRQSRDQSSPSGQENEQAKAAAGIRERGRWRPRRGRLGLRAGASFGTAPGAQAELGGAAGLGLGWLYSEVDLSVLLPRSKDLVPDGEVRLWSLKLGLRECALWGERVQWGPCATIDALRTLGHAAGLSNNLPDQALFWAFAGLGLHVSWNFQSCLELALGAGVGVAISPRPRFTVEGLGEVATVSAWPSYIRIGFGFVTR